LALFEKEADYAAFEKVLAEAFERLPMRLVTYCLMPNHWHLVLWPARDGQLSSFMQWLTTTHMRRWHAHRGTRGTGPVYQGRFKSFPIEQDGHFLTVCRYVERNALRAKLVERAEDWRWCGLGRRRRKDVDSSWLMARGDWPVVPPRNWRAVVNRAETEAELQVLRQSVNRGRPFGEAVWQRRTAARLKLESSLRDPWRPKKVKTGKKK
jgi:putative transposase